MENEKDSVPAVPEMPYARCGASGLRLPKISLGLWHNFGGIEDRKSVV